MPSPELTRHKATREALLLTVPVAVCAYGCSFAPFA